MIEWMGKGVARDKCAYDCDVLISGNKNYIMIRLRNGVSDRFDDYVIIGIEKNRMYFKKCEDKRLGFCLNSTKNIYTRVIKTTSKKLKKILEPFCGFYDLEYDVEKNLDFIEKKGDAQE